MSEIKGCTTLTSKKDGLILHGITRWLAMKRTKLCKIVNCVEQQEF